MEKRGVFKRKLLMYSLLPSDARFLEGFLYSTWELSLGGSMGLYRVQDGFLLSSYHHVLMYTPQYTMTAILVYGQWEISFTQEKRMTYYLV